MRKFDTKIQYLNYKVLREVARFAWNDTLLENIINIPQIVVPGDTPTMRCCIYKERAILGERIKLAMGGDRENPNVIEVIEIACDECPMSGYEVTDACRGCLAHRCDDVCPKNAITYDQNYVAHIDKTKCVNCGACARACPYSAITNRRRPCESACKVKAISMSEKGPAEIHNDKCVECGACVYHCPFGAVLDKAYILDVIDMIKKSENNSKYKVYAMVAPAIASQFTFARTRQVIEGIKRLGFYDVTEAALGADMVAYEESKELAEKGFLISSCCPAFVEYIHKNFSDLEQYVSHNLSPMATLGKYIKEKDPTAKVVFIGPCTAKKEEAQKETVKPYIDAVITFEELQALFDSTGIDIADVDVGRNVGAQLQIDQAEADKRIAQAKAEERRAMAVAQEQENKAEVQGMRARVIEAEAEVPRAIAAAFREGKLGVMDYYNMQNVISDTKMRDSIAGGAQAEKKE